MPQVEIITTQIEQSKADKYKVWRCLHGKEEKFDLKTRATRRNNSFKSDKAMFTMVENISGNCYCLKRTRFNSFHNTISPYSASTAV